jgi:CrcB protein
MMTATLPTLLAIALGGALGALARFAASSYFNQTVQVHHTVHIGTMLVNIIGSFVMGLVYVYIVEQELFNPHWKSILMVGFLGAFTTFSSYSLEAINFYEQGYPMLALVYVVTTVVACLCAAGGAIYIARTLL